MINADEIAGIIKQRIATFKTDDQAKRPWAIPQSDA